MEKLIVSGGEALDLYWQEGTGPRFEDARLVRRAVFVEEQGFSLIGEFDEKDAESTHLILYREDRPVATARMFREAPGVLHIGRVAVAREMRGRGVGLAALGALAARARKAGESALVLGAQKDKADFYIRAGFAPTGEEYPDEGVPHMMMRMAL